MKIQINHIGKMEGHTDFVAEILKGDVKSAKIMTTEGARLIEGILIGRHFSEAPIITSRICGICPVVHKLTSIKAMENALKIKPSEQTVKLRKVMESAQIIHSHALHLFFLSLPDFFNIEDDLKFINEYTKEAKAAIAVREWALGIIETIGGRAVHPINCEVGGFKVMADKQKLNEVLASYEKILKSALVLVHFVLKIKYPQLNRPTTYISLTNDSEYGTYEGDIKILTGKGDHRSIKSGKFTKNIKEIEDPYLAAKSAELNHQAFMVGAIARINNNHTQLNPLAKGLLKGLRWKLPQYNSFANISSQAIEIVHYIEECKKLLDEVLPNLKDEKTLSKKLKIIAGANPMGKETEGSGAVEAPRGTLYHYYKIDKDGYIKACQIISPTVSFLKNLEEDIMAYLPKVMDMPEDKRARKIRALIRAYDPCISCATH